MQESEKPFRCGFIAIVGRPNVGKSTFLNKVIGERLAAVSPKAQTTRRRFRGIRTDEDSQMIFVDTPGVHRAPEGKKLNEYCVSEAFDAIQDADVFLYIVDGSRSLKLEDPSSDEAYLVERLVKTLEKRPAPLMIVLNKMDLWEKGKSHFAGQSDFTALLERFPKRLGVFPVSARSGEGLDPLLKAIKDSIPEGEAFFPKDELTDQNMRVIAGELIQEQLFHFLGEEIPYSCAVEILRFEDSSAGRLPEIEAAIHVERESQKSMVIGKGGAKIKEIGKGAREAIEKVMDGKIVLKLHVKHSPKWTKDIEQLRRLGYTLPTNKKNL